MSQTQKDGRQLASVLRYSVVVRFSLVAASAATTTTTTVSAATTTAAVATATATAASTAAAALWRALLEAIAAVHWAVTARLERYFRLLAAVCALRWEHLARAGRVTAAAATTTTVTAAASARVATGCLASAPAIRAPLRLVREATACVELLIFCGECEFRSAVHARQRPVAECHLTTSDECFLVVRTGEA
jgi:hypothetical protein